jgi:hypothetical protein
MGDDMFFNLGPRKFQSKFPVEKFWEQGSCIIKKCPQFKTLCHHAPNIHRTQQHNVQSTHRGTNKEVQSFFLITNQNALMTSQ